MQSIRLTVDQIAKLRKVPGSGAGIIKFACKRYETGELVIQNTTIDKNSENVLQVFPIRRKPKYPDDQIRRILDAHFANPRDYSKQIAELDRQIGAMMQEYASMPVIIENSPEWEDQDVDKQQ